MRATAKDPWPSVRSGQTGVTGPPGEPPIVGIFRWCGICKQVSLDPRAGNGNCSVCHREKISIINAWCPEGAILVWSEESVTHEKEDSIVGNSDRVIHGCFMGRMVRKVWDFCLSHSRV